jgi:hypothetical protein
VLLECGAARSVRCGVVGCWVRCGAVCGGWRWFGAGSRGALWPAPEVAASEQRSACPVSSFSFRNTPESQAVQSLAFGIASQQRSRHKAHAQLQPDYTALAAAGG